jgi:cell wall assembly regulator SMI1
MEADWQRILAWVETHAPDLLDLQAPPADRTDLADAERRLSMRLPTALRTFYTLQNGPPEFAVFPALDPELSAFGPLSLDEIEFVEIEDEDDAPKPAKRRGRGEPPPEDFDADPGVRGEFWNPNWIPFAAATDRGDYLMLDFAPARGGRPGQVIEWRHDTNERRLAAASLPALLKQTADAMEAGRTAWDENRGARRATNAD